MKNNWALKVFFLTLLLAIIFSVLANFLGQFNNIVLSICIILIICIGVMFDIIGTSALSCDEKVLHSKASQKLKGAKEAIKLVKKSNVVSSFCNDVVGDVCGIVSGSLMTVLVVNLFIQDLSLWNVLFTSILSAFTVGGKALGKKIAINNANDIIFLVGKILSIFKHN